jgi:ABC-type transport system substrate-binding protein
MMCGVLSACAGSDRAAHHATHRTLRVGLPDGVVRLSPYGVAADDWLAAGVMYEGLVDIDTADAVVPALARAWAQQDTTRYRFWLRTGVRFSDGTQLTARDVVASWTAGLTSDDRADVLGGGMAMIAGARDVADGRTTHIRGVSAVDDTTLDVTLESPRAGFLRMLASRTFDVWRPGTPPIGTGPWRFVQRSPDSTIARSVRYVRRDDYWGSRAGYDSLELRYVAPNAFATALVNEQIDCAPIQNYGQLRELALDARVVLPPSQQVNLARVIFNHRSPRLRDPDVRRAIQRVLDVPALSTLLVLRNVEPWRSALPPQRSIARSVAFPVRDDSTARRLLAGRFDAQRDTLRVATWSETARDTSRTIAAAIAAQLERFGLPARVVPTGVYDADIGLGEIDLSIEVWYPTTLDAESFLTEQFHSTQSSPYANSGGFADRDVDAAIERLQRTTDTTARRRLVQSIDSLLADRAALQPLWLETMMTAHHRDITQCVLSPSRSRFLEARPIVAR